MLKLEEAHARLKTSRMASGYKTATEFCKKTGIPLSTYNMHETGKRKMQPEIAEKYAQLLDVDSAWLITGVGSPYPSTLSSEEPLSQADYVNLLNYCKPLPAKLAANSSLPINTALFCTIFTEVVQAMNELQQVLDIHYLSAYVAEVYADIVQTSSVPQEQLSMVSLALTLFKKNLKLLNKA